MHRDSCTLAVVALTACVTRASPPSDDDIRAALVLQIAVANTSSIVPLVQYHWTMAQHGLPEPSQLALTRRNATEAGTVGELNRRLLQMYDRREWPATEYRLWIFDKSHWRLSVDPTYDPEGWWDSAGNGSHAWRIGKDYIDALDVISPQPGYDNQALFAATIKQFNLSRFGGLHTLNAKDPSFAEKCSIQRSPEDHVTLVGRSSLDDLVRTIEALWIDGRLQPSQLTIGPAGGPVSTLTFDDWQFEPALNEPIAHTVKNQNARILAPTIIKILAVERLSTKMQAAVLRQPENQKEDAVRGVLAPSSLSVRVGVATTSTYFDDNHQPIETLTSDDPGGQNARLLDHAGYWLTGSAAVAAIALAGFAKYRKGSLTRHEGDAT